MTRLDKTITVLWCLLFICSIALTIIYRDVQKKQIQGNVVRSAPSLMIPVEDAPGVR